MIRFTKTHCLILCELGHLVEIFDLKDWAGSLIESEVSAYQAGEHNRITRRTAQCNGYGHAKGEA